MARSALSKLKDANASIADLKVATSADEAEVTFHRAASDIKSAFEKIGPETIAAVAGRGDASARKKIVREWWAAEKRDARNDDLVEWVFSARNGDHHIERDARIQIDSYTHIRHFSTPPDLPPGASVAVGGDGVWLITNDGTPYEKRRRLDFDGHTAIALRLVNPPTTHLGEQIENNSPVQVLKLAHAYVAQVWERSVEIVEQR